MKTGTIAPIVGPEQHASPRSAAPSVAGPGGTVPEARSAPSADGRTARAREASQTARLKRKREQAGNPTCTRIVERPGCAPRVCGARTVQNDIERARGVFWCPRCQRYPWGSGGGRAGGGPDKVPADAYNHAGAQASTGNHGDGP